MSSVYLIWWHGGNSIIYWLYEIVLGCARAGAPKWCRRERKKMLRVFLLHASSRRRRRIAYSHLNEHVVNFSTLSAVASSSSSSYSSNIVEGALRRHKYAYAQTYTMYSTHVNVWKEPLWWWWWWLSLFSYFLLVMLLWNNPKATTLTF